MSHPVPPAPDPLRRWDGSAITAGVIVIVIISVPAWVGASWALGAERWTLTAIFSSVEFIGFVLGAACAAWAERSAMPLAHGIVTAVGTYIGLQVVLSGIRLATGTGIDLMNAFFFATLAAVAGALGGGLGLFVRRRLPSRIMATGAGRSGTDQWGSDQRGTS